MPTDTTDIITCEHVDRSFTPEVGVFDLTFTVATGTIFGLIGPSGSGKTTTVRLLTGLYKPDRGSVRVLEHTPHTFTAATRKRIGYMPQHFVLHPNLTVWENLMFAASLYGMPLRNRRPRLLSVLEFVELADVRHRASHKLSGGMQRRLGLACALVNNPRLIFADEPTAGIDPVLRGKFWEHFRQLRSDGYTLFVTTQYINEIAQCDCVGVMRQGHLLYVDTPGGLRRRALDGEVIKIIVGEEHITEASAMLKRQPVVKRVRSVPEHPEIIYVHVEDAGSAMPTLVNLFHEHADIPMQQIEEHQPPFDDIFITLMKRAEERQRHA